MLDYLIEQAQKVSWSNADMSLLLLCSLGMLIGLLLLRASKGLRGMASFGWLVLIISGAALIQHIGQGAMT